MQLPEEEGSLCIDCILTSRAKPKTTDDKTLAAYHMTAVHMPPGATSFRMVLALAQYHTPPCCMYSAPIGGLLPCAARCVVGLRWLADVSCACVPLLVSCSGFGLPMHAQLLCLFVTHLDCGCLH